MSELKYKLNDKPPVLMTLILAIQHALAMFAGVVTVPLIIALATKMDQNSKILFINAALIASGISTFIQVYRFGMVGSGRLILMGSSGAFIFPAIKAGAQGGLALICGMVLITAPIEFILGFVFDKINRVIDRSVSGIIIILIAFSIIPICFSYIGGGRGVKDFGNIKYLLISIVVIAIIMILSLSKKHILNSLALIIGITIGYIISYFAGILDFTALIKANIYHMPKILWTGFKFDWNLFLLFSIAYLISMFDTVGTVSMILSIEDNKDDNDKDVYKRAILADSVCSIICAIFGTTANTTYSGNSSVVKLTKASSRIIGIYTSIILILMGFFPKIAAIISIMPTPVVGAVMFIAITIMLGMGIKLINLNSFSNKKIFNIAIPLIYMLGIQTNHKILSNLPNSLKGFINADSALTISAIMAIFLNLFLKERD